MPRGANSPAMFEAYVNNVIKEAVDAVTEKTLEQLQLYVAKEWYIDSPNRTTDVYTRTNQFIESLTKSPAKKMMKSYVSQVFSDSSQIKPQEQGGLFNAHMSVSGDTSWRGIPISELIVGIFEEGVTGSAYKDMVGIGMFKATDRWLHSHITRLLKAEFKKYGLRLMKK